MGSYPIFDFDLQKKWLQIMAYLHAKPLDIEQRKSITLHKNSKKEVHQV